MSTQDSLEEGLQCRPAHIVPLQEMFDIVIAQNELHAASEISETIAQHTMRRVQSDLPPSAGQHLSLEDLSISYFQMMRSKGSGFSGNELSTVNVMSTLLNLASCHAKLCFRNVADTGDALVSIMMTEETVAARFGISRLGFVPMLDGKENVTRLYGRSGPGADHSQDPGIIAHAPFGDQVFDMREDMPCEDDHTSISIETERDHVMDGLYDHLCRIIRDDAHSTVMVNNIDQDEDF
ncbi:hypothetical protein BGZ83_007004 [Gryganskiella cystojenkinii]|nr:hypothetical protein BGZ83_007004 [Gryganskiella cystojenkinii]